MQVFLVMKIEIEHVIEMVETLETSTDASIECACIYYTVVCGA